MSTNCIRCVKNERTDIDLLCDECRRLGAPERAGLIMAGDLPAGDRRRAELLKMKGVIEGGWAGISKAGTIVDRREVPDAVPIPANPMFNTPEPKVTLPADGSHRTDGTHGLYVPRDVMAAHEAWGASCGPGAFAAMRRCPVMAVRECFPGFPEKCYVNLTMMQAAFEVAEIKGYAVTFDRWPRADEVGLLQIQIDGPWNDIGVPPQAALRHTHWVAIDGADAIYDVNAEDEWLTRARWETEIVPRLLQAHKRSTGVLSRRGMYFVRGTRAANFAQNL